MLNIKEEDIDKITEAFYLILKGKKPTPIELPEDYPDNEIKQEQRYRPNLHLVQGRPEF
jgi:thiamine pyrophosphate-dependent acetolactate synthase large subunit-like protein